MVEELFLALVMSLVFALPAWYLCIFQGNFAVFWLAWLLSLADGIGERRLRGSTRSSCVPDGLQCALCTAHISSGDSYGPHAFSGDVYATYAPSRTFVETIDWSSAALRSFRVCYSGAVAVHGRGECDVPDHPGHHALRLRLPYPVPRHQGLAQVVR